VTAVLSRTFSTPLHPFHAALLAGIIPLFLGALLSDVAYALSYEIQWKNFASWLIAGGLVFGGLAVVWALIGLFKPGGRGPRSLIYLALLLLTWALAFINALIHAKDAWASMPEGLILSALVAILAIVVTGVGFSTFRRRDME